MRLFSITGNGSCTRRDNGMYEPRVRMRVSESVYRSRSRWHTVKMQVQATRGTINSGWVFGMVVLSNSVEAEIFGLDY